MQISWRSPLMNDTRERIRQDIRARTLGIPVGAKPSKADSHQTRAVGKRGAAVLPGVPQITPAPSVGATAMSFPCPIHCSAFCSLLLFLLYPLCTLPYLLLCFLIRVPQSAIHTGCPCRLWLTGHPWPRGSSPEVCSSYTAARSGPKVASNHGTH